MLADDQIKLVARRICEEADDRIDRAGDRFDRQQLWDTVRHSCHAIQAVAEIENGALEQQDRARRARYVIGELESALESARKAGAILDWTARRERDAH